MHIFFIMLLKYIIVYKYKLDVKKLFTISSASD